MYIRWHIREDFSDSREVSESRPNVRVSWNVQLICLPVLLTGRRGTGLYEPHESCHHHFCCKGTLICDCIVHNYSVQTLQVNEILACEQQWYEQSTNSIWLCLNLCHDVHVRFSLASCIRDAISRYARHGTSNGSTLSWKQRFCCCCGCSAWTSQHRKHVILTTQLQ